MKFSIIILSSFLLFSCKENSQVSQSKAFEAPRSHPYAESVHMEGYSEKGKKILHQLFTKNPSDNNLFEVDFASNDRLEKTQAKVYVISKEKDQVYYFPIGTNKKWIEENVDIFRYSHYKMFWINGDLNIGTPSYLIMTNERDVLLNEQNFTTKTFLLEKVSSVEFKQLSKFQTIELDIEKFKINPGLSSIQKTKISGRDCGDERPRPCRCDYEINTFNSQYNIDNSLIETKEEVKYKLYLDHEFVLDLNGRHYRKSFLPENDYTDFKIDFETEFYIAGMSEQRAKSNECKSLTAEKIEGVGKYLYDVKVTIKGVNELNYQLESI